MRADRAGSITDEPKACIRGLDDEVIVGPDDARGNTEILSSQVQLRHRAVTDVNQIYVMVAQKAVGGS